MRVQFFPRSSGGALDLLSRDFEVLRFQAKPRQDVGVDHGSIGACVNDKWNPMTFPCIRVHVDANLFDLRADVR